MDGAGRSRRSKGSSEPKTDLKAAAIGAAVLLREYLGLPKKRAKATHDRETPHRALSCSGYSRSDFIISEKGPIYLETNTLPGLTKASLYPKMLKAQGIEFTDFMHDQIALAIKNTQR